MSQSFLCEPLAQVRANLIDRFFKALDNDIRSCDFVKLVELDGRGLQLDELFRRLQHGLDVACQYYPKTRFRFESGFWRFCESSPQLGLVRRALDNPLQNLEFAYNEPLSPPGLALKETLFYDPSLGSYWLMLRFHHSLGDATSAMNLLAVQLAEAFGYPHLPPPDSATWAPLRETRVRRPRLSQGAKVETRSHDFLNLQASNFTQTARCVVALPLNVAAMANLLSDLRHADRELAAVSLTESDLIMTWAFRAVGRVYGASVSPPLVFSVTVNARAEKDAGFGNYSGMIRISPTISAEEPLSRWLQQVNLIKRQQLQSGAAEIKPPWWLGKLPFPLLRALIKLLNRLKKTATSSALYSYYRVEASSALNEASLCVKSVYAVASLNKNYPFLIHAMSFNGVTQLLLTYDRCNTVVPKLERIVCELKRLIRAECPHALTSEVLAFDEVNA